MAVHVYIFLLVGCLLFFLALLWRLDWLHLQPSHSRGGAKRSRLHRLLKPRCPDDCPACRLASTASSGEEPAPGPVRPWREVKSRRGAPKRVNTEGFACPNPQCPYCGITDAQVHAAFWRWQAWSCRADPDVSLSGLPHDVQCSTRHSVVSFENPLAADRRGALCAGRRTGSFRRRTRRRATIRPPSRAFLTRAGKHAELFHEHSFRNLHIPHLQLDEIRTRLRSTTQVLWLWLAIDPCTRDSARAASESPHTTCGAYAHPLPATAFGP